MHKSVGRVDTRTSLLLGAALAVLSVVLFACLAVRLMNYELRRDEELYVPPVRLLEGVQIVPGLFLQLRTRIGVVVFMESGS